MKLAPNTRQQAKSLLNELIDMHMTSQLKECRGALQDIIDKDETLRCTRRVTDAAAQERRRPLLKQCSYLGTSSSKQAKPQGIFNCSALPRWGT